MLDKSRSLEKMVDGRKRIDNWIVQKGGKRLLVIKIVRSELLDL